MQSKRFEERFGNVTICREAFANFTPGMIQSGLWGRELIVYAILKSSPITMSIPQIIEFWGVNRTSFYRSLKSLAAEGYIRKAQRGIYEICRYGD